MGSLNYSGKEVLITGGLGFIGSNLAKSLVSMGAKVTLVDSLIPEYGGNLFNVNSIKNEVIINICDVRDSHAIEYLIKNKDILFNLAGQTSHMDSMTSPHIDLEINASAQLSILEACKKKNPEIKIVYASTRQIYGKPQYLPVDEKHVINPVDVNGINKLSGEHYHMLYNNVYGIRSCALRLTNTYGPGMRIKDARQTFLGIWIKLLLKGKTFKIYGDGTQLRDFNYIDDCVCALLLAGIREESNGKIYNLGSKEVTSLNALATLLIQCGHNGNFENINFPSDRKAIDIGDYYSNYDLISNELGWNPKKGLKEGLTETLNFYNEHFQKYNDDKDGG